MRNPAWELLHPKATEEHLGYLPGFLFEGDPRPAKEQLNTHYIGGWFPFSGHGFNPETMILTYPGDPPMKPIARTKLRDETIFLFPHAWVLILQEDGTWEIARMD